MYRVDGGKEITRSDKVVDFADAVIVVYCNIVFCVFVSFWKK